MGTLFRNGECRMRNVELWRRSRSAGACAACRSVDSLIDNRCWSFTNFGQSTDITKQQELSSFHTRK